MCVRSGLIIIYGSAARLLTLLVSIAVASTTCAGDESPAVPAASDDTASAYVLRPDDATIEIPSEFAGLKTKLIDEPPEPSPEGFAPVEAGTLSGASVVPEPLRTTNEDRTRLNELRRRLPAIRSYQGGAPPALRPGATPACENHEAIGTDIPGRPLKRSETGGTWVSMVIAEKGITGLSGWLYTTFSNIAAQTLEVLGVYATGNSADLVVFDWSCVDGKQGSPACSAQSAWVYSKSLKTLPAKYKYYYWDCCQWQKALALANVSRYAPVVINMPHMGKIAIPVWINEAVILNWQTLKWERFYSRRFMDRDSQPPRAWGPTAFVEFISNAGCPNVPRLGFREIRFVDTAGGWQAATSANSSMRFDLPNDYRYCLLDPNHEWCICQK